MTPAVWSTLDLVVIDVEGNGYGELVELAAVPVVGGVVGEPVEWLVRPCKPITVAATRVHGITNDAVCGQPPVDEIADDIVRTIGDALPVGHHVATDLAVMRRACPQWCPVEAFDTLLMARAALSLPAYGLVDLGWSLNLGRRLSEHRPHRAGYDAVVAAHLLVELASGDRPDPWTIAELRRFGGIELAEHQPSLFAISHL